MPQVSQRKLKNGLENKLFDIFFQIVCSVQNQKDFSSVFLDMFSHTERLMIAKRIAIMLLLTKEIDYRSICKVLKVSVTTVCKYRMLLDHNQAIKQKLAHIQQNDKVMDAIAQIYLIFRPPGGLHVNWKAAWQLKNELDQKKKEGI